MFELYAKTKTTITGTISITGIINWIISSNISSNTNSLGTGQCNY
jgi:hypothetical protein